METTGASLSRRGVSIPWLIGVLLLSGWEGKAFARPPAAEVRSSTPRAEAGIYHVLLRGQTLYALARAYEVAVPRLAETNGIDDPTRIPSGTPIFIPGASRVLDIPSPREFLLAWPLQGEITTSFGAEEEGAHHEGIDIDGEMGQEIRAAAAGRVVWAGVGRKYGRMVVIDHGGGLATLYAHASRLLVEVDEEIQAGEPIAEVGRSGNASGTHLHFEVRRDGHPIDPLPLLASGVIHAAAAR